MSDLSVTVWRDWRASLQSLILDYEYIVLVMSPICIYVVKLGKPLSKLDLPTLRMCSTEERTQRNK